MCQVRAEDTGLSMSPNQEQCYCLIVESLNSTDYILQTNLQVWTSASQHWKIMP